ncbi:UNKNOWN [Stylonychia lemnae]|uniref:Transmembrane protein n=1 Tax=Stylonychia lemnae TaxID=5949 RepID=A0A078B1W9_STYLE|nr:UNKNOWN [Stylonychia lemnae]|eukprot:CDW88281.1 UNKNOWN [Stylonychia lemnae]
MNKRNKLAIYYKMITECIKNIDCTEVAEYIGINFDQTGELQKMQPQINQLTNFEVLARTKGKIQIDEEDKKTMTFLYEQQDNIKMPNYERKGNAGASKLPQNQQFVPKMNFNENLQDNIPEKQQEPEIKKPEPTERRANNRFQNNKKPVVDDQIINEQLVGQAQQANQQAQNADKQGGRPKIDLRKQKPQKNAGQQGEVEFDVNKYVDDKTIEKVDYYNQKTNPQQHQQKQQERKSQDNNRQQSNQQKQEQQYSNNPSGPNSQSQNSQARIGKQNKQSKTQASQQSATIGSSKASFSILRWLKDPIGLIFLVVDFLFSQNFIIMALIYLVYYFYSKQKEMNQEILKRTQVHSENNKRDAKSKKNEKKSDEVQHEQTDSQKENTESDESNQKGEKDDKTEVANQSSKNQSNQVKNRKNKIKK